MCGLDPIHTLGLRMRRFVGPCESRAVFFITTATWSRFNLKKKKKKLSALSWSAHPPTHPPPTPEKIYIFYYLHLYQVPMAPTLEQLPYRAASYRDTRHLFGPILICSFCTECPDKIGPDPSIFAHTGPKEKKLNYAIICVRPAHGSFFSFLTNLFCSLSFLCVKVQCCIK